MTLWIAADYELYNGRYAAHVLVGIKRRRYYDNIHITELFYYLSFRSCISISSGVNLIFSNLAGTPPIIL